MPTLPLEGVNLSYTTLGSGPLLLLIPGADGRGSVFNAVAQHLSAHYKTILYDRRGFSQSHITGPQDYSARLTTDASDAAQLIAHLSGSGEGAAAVMGTSSGAIVALTLLANHPERVSKLVAHEPPAFCALPPPFRAQAEGSLQHIYSIYRASGPIAAMQAFASALAADTEGEGQSEGALMRSHMDPAHSDEVRANSLFWFEFELRQYPSSGLDLEAVARSKEKLVPAAGIASGDEVGVKPIQAIAAKCGKEVSRLPGGHLGAVMAPQSWAEALVKSLDGT